MPESFDERAQSQENKEKEEKVEGLNEVVPPEDLRSAEELVEEAREALAEVKGKQHRRFIDEETQLPKVGGNFGSELKAAVQARREANKWVNSDKHYEITVPKWDECDKHIDSIGRMIAAALQKGKSGYDFRTALPYKIGHIGGVEMVFWPQAGSSSLKPYPTELLRETIEQFLPEDSRWMGSYIVSRVIEHLFPSEENKGAEE